MNKMLVVIDMQNDFIDGALANESAKAIIPNIITKIKSGDYHFFAATKDTHGEDYLRTSEGIKLPVSHCIKGTPGWEINKEILDELPSNTLVIEKPTFGYIEWAKTLSAYFDDTFPEDFPSEIELVGTCTDICVVSNALLLRAAYPSIKIVVHADCCAGVTPEKHEAALEVMRSCQIEVI